VVITWVDQFLSGGCAGTVVRDYTVVDECGNVNTFQQIISLIDNVAPVITEGPADATYECDEEVPAASTSDVAAEDNCTEITINISEEIIDGDCPQNFTIVRTYVAVDQCLNESEPFVQTINVVDTTAPEFTFVAENVTIECDQDVPAGNAEAVDNCGDVVITTSEEVFEGECANSFTIVRTYTATDECGNETIATQNIFVVDTTAPEFVSVPGEITIECDQDIPETMAEAVDNCGEVTILVSDEILESDCEQEYTILRTYIAVDACGNESEPATQVIEVVDTTAPELIGLPEATLVLDCEATGDVPAPAEVTAIDNCEDDVVVTFSEEIIGDLPTEGSSADCNATTPAPFANGLDCTNNQPWSLVLFQFNNVSADRYSTIEASWVEFPDGSATLTGTVQNLNNPGSGWEISAQFQDGKPWEEWSTQAFPTSFKDDCNLSNGEHVNWIYYIMTPGATLTGFGDYEGSVLTLAHMPSNFFYGYQVGLGANNVNDNYGGGGWFTYSGIFNGQQVTGAGDFAFDHDCCPQYEIQRTWCASDCAGNESCFTQTISFEDLSGILPQPAPIGVGNADVTDKGDFFIISLAPNPAVVNTKLEFYSKVNNTVRIEVYDMTGRVVDIPYEGEVAADMTYQHIINTTNLRAGVYTIRIASLSHTDYTKMVVNK
jgi:hypothetical protein